jgi:hypothetical protein
VRSPHATAPSAGDTGALWAYYSAKAVRVDCRKGALASYLNRTGTFKYFHCKRCGCVTHYQRVNTYDDTRLAINARMMDPADIAGVRMRKLDVRKKKMNAKTPRSPR